MEYKFVKVKDLVKAVEEGYEVGFTFDTIENVLMDGVEDFEPTVWYGIKKINLFDYDQWMIGYYGGGIESVLWSYGEDDVSPTEFFIDFYAREVSGNVTENTLVCVEALDCFKNDEEFQLEISKAEFEALDQERKETLLMETCVYFTDMWNELDDKSFYIDSLTKAQVITEWAREFESENFNSPEYKNDFLALADGWFKRKFDNTKDYFEAWR